MRGLCITTPYRSLETMGWSRSDLDCSFNLERSSKLQQLIRLLLASRPKLTNSKTRFVFKPSHMIKVERQRDEIFSPSSINITAVNNTNMISCRSYLGNLPSFAITSSCNCRKKQPDLARRCILDLATHFSMVIVSTPGILLESVPSRGGRYTMIAPWRYMSVIEAFQLHYYTIAADSFSPVPICDAEVTHNSTHVWLITKLPVGDRA